MRPPDSPTPHHPPDPPANGLSAPSASNAAGSGAPAHACRVAFLTAGAAGMYCGSCMHDNTLARSLRTRGFDCLLQPIYTPIRTDESSVASGQLFFGGIHIYLLQRLPWFRLVPAPLRRLLDWPPLIRLATRRIGSTDPAQLGKLTISMLRGREGDQRDEVERLTDWLAKEIRPDAVLLTNLLIGGVLPSIRERLPNARLIVILQGDDIFLDHLPETFRDEAIRRCHALAKHVDRFVVNSRFYRDKMASMFDLPLEKFDVIPLSIDPLPFVADREESTPPNSNTPDSTPANATPAESTPTEPSDQPFRIGYLARVSPEKGLHHLVDAFIDLAKQPGHARTTLDVAGWLGDPHRDYLRRLHQRVDRAGLGDRFRYHGSPDMKGKVRFLRSIDVLSVPTDYADPKGLFVLEALASGVPVVQPDHGAFPELIASTRGGLLFPPSDAGALADTLRQLHSDPNLRRELGQRGRQHVLNTHGIDAAAETIGHLIRGVSPSESSQFPSTRSEPNPSEPPRGEADPSLSESDPPPGETVNSPRDEGSTRVR